MIFNCRRMISFASKMMAIKPGDIFYTGTPHGVVFGKPKAEQVWLKPGDKWCAAWRSWANWRSA